VHRAGCFDGDAHRTFQRAVKLAYVIARVLEDAFLHHATAGVQNRQGLLTGMQVAANHLHLGLLSVRASSGVSRSSLLRPRHEADFVIPSALSVSYARKRHSLTCVRSGVSGGLFWIWNKGLIVASGPGGGCRFWPGGGPWRISRWGKRSVQIAGELGRKTTERLARIARGRDWWRCIPQRRNAPQKKRNNVLRREIKSGEKCPKGGSLRELGIRARPYQVEANTEIERAIETRKRHMLRIAGRLFLSERQYGVPGNVKFRAEGGFCIALVNWR
jgi:hypothetical protein